MPLVASSRRKYRRRVPAGTGTGGGGGTAPSAVGSPPPFNLNTISQGISTADFYLTVPAAVLKFLETDSSTKVLAKPQLRGAEGQKVSLNLGEEVPVVSTTFTPLATGGAAANPLTSYTYRPIGVIVDMTPRVTYSGEIILDLSLENSARAGDVAVAGVTVPAFTSRKVTTRLRLRDGESNLLAGLLREDERRSLRGFPGLLRMPILSQLFASNDTNIRQTDIVMLLTPRIVRTHELTARDLGNIYIGTQGNMALGGPPPLITGPAAEPLPEPVVPPPTGPTGPTGPPQLQLPPGSSPTPGLPPRRRRRTPPRRRRQPRGPRGPRRRLCRRRQRRRRRRRRYRRCRRHRRRSPPPRRRRPPRRRLSRLRPPRKRRRNPRGFCCRRPPRCASARDRTPCRCRLQVRTRLTDDHAVDFVQPGGAARARACRKARSCARAASPRCSRSRSIPRPGGIDIAITRPGDQVGAAGTGLLAAILFEPIAAGSATLNVTGVGSTVTGAQAPLIFQPAVVAVK